MKSSKRGSSQASSSLGNLRVVRVALFGAQGVGKSTIAKQFVYNEFDSEEELSMVEVYQKQVSEFVGDRYMNPNFLGSCKWRATDFGNTRHWPRYGQSDRRSVLCRVRRVSTSILDMGYEFLKRSWRNPFANQTSKIAWGRFRRRVPDTHGPGWKQEGSTRGRTDFQ